MRAPYNPFARTMASNEARFGLSKERAEEQGNDPKQSSGSGGRAALDVDAFKNILLTGSATPSPPSGVVGASSTASAAPSTTFAKPHDSSSSNTDTSSIFDPNYGLHPESPRNSFEEYETASESDDNERSGLMGEGRSDDLAPPAPPKPKAKGPQTVSFADFDQSIPDGFQSSGPRAPPVNSHITGILRPSLSRSSSDLNKPLPPPPAGSSDLASSKLIDKPLPPSQQPTPTIAAEDDTATPKKAPPPPPTRRKVGDTARPRSSSNLSQETTYPPDSDEQPSKTAPPPPPTRKPQPTTQISEAPSEASSEKQSPSQSTSEVPKAVPPPPPRRHPSKTGPSPRVSESPAQKPGDAFLAAVAPAQGNAPPAPPRRRAGGSKRTSMDGAGSSSEQSRRPSGNSFDSERSTSLSSLRQAAVPVEGNEQAVVTPMESQRDILADMSAFQAEIEALRLKSENSR